MNVKDFQYISELLHKRSGLVLTQDKAYLLESRLNPVARKWEMKGLEELIGALRSGGKAELVDDVTEAMTTNESFFFRDQRPFDQFRDVVLPHLLKERVSNKRIRIWSAAASSGQEAYTIAILLAEQKAALAGWNIEIVATDLSREFIARAGEGVYSQFEIQRGLPISLLMKYFRQEGDRWRIDESLRRMVKFKTFNLLDDPSPLGKFDVVFCRNVLIYFDQPTKRNVLDRVANLMPQDGFLYLGGAETVLGLSDRFQLIPGQRGIYGLVSGSSTFEKAAG